MGLKGNLTCGEILEQLVHAISRVQVRKIVFMGMGEPLNNYEQVGVRHGCAELPADDRRVPRRRLRPSWCGVAC